MLFVSVFFDTPEVTKIVLPKVLQNFRVLQNCTCWPRELNQKGFSFFPRNIQYRARLKGPPFSFFGIVTFFRKKFRKGPPSIFLMICDTMVEKSQRVPWPFGFIGYCGREYLDMAPTWAGSGLSHIGNVMARITTDLFRCSVRS